MVSKNSLRTLLISSPDDAFIRTLQERLVARQDSQVRLGCMTFKIIDVEPFRPLLPSSAPQEIKRLSEEHRQLRYLLLQSMAMQMEPMTDSRLRRNGSRDCFMLTWASCQREAKASRRTAKEYRRMPNNSCFRHVRVDRARKRLPVNEERDKMDFEKTHWRFFSVNGWDFGLRSNRL
jgi:hypothetical protein